MTGARPAAAAKLMKRIMMADAAMLGTSGGEPALSRVQVAVAKDATAATLVTQLSDGDQAVPVLMAAKGNALPLVLIMAAIHATKTITAAAINPINSGLSRSNPATINHHLGSRHGVRFALL